MGPPWAARISALVPWNTSSFSDLAAPSIVFHFFPLSPLTARHFLPFLKYVSKGTTILVGGLSCALQWVSLSWLELSVSSTGQPRPLLTTGHSCRTCCQHLHTCTQYSSIEQNFPHFFKSLFMGFPFEMVLKATWYGIHLAK